MRYAFALVAVLATTAVTSPAQAQQGQNSQWCADYGREGTVNCGFVSYEQCRATISGFNTGTCYRNPQYSPRYPGQR